MFRNKIRFNGEELLEIRPNPKVEDHPLSAVRDCLFNIFAATLHIGGHSSIRDLRTRHAGVTGTHLSRTFYGTCSVISRDVFLTFMLTFLAPEFGIEILAHPVCKM